MRFSHLTSYAGVGAIVRGAEDRLMAVVDTRYWTDKHHEISADIIPYVERIKMALKIDRELRMPPEAREQSETIQGSYIPAVLFPTYAACRKCGLLHNNPWRKRGAEFNEKLRCDNQECNSRLEQVTWCAVSNQGHLDDVPWHACCHTRENINCRVDYDSNYLRLDIDANGKKIVKCLRCKSTGKYEKARTRIINKIQPWMYGNSPKLTETDIVEILEVNNPGVYLPVWCKALVIPPESRVSKSAIVDQIYSNTKIRKEIDGIRNPLLRKAKLKELATRYRCSVQEIEDALIQIDNGYPDFDEILPTGDLLKDEYQAFLEPLENLREDEDFVTEHNTAQWEQFSGNKLSNELSAIVKSIDNQIIVKRLREILIFTGFERGFQGKLKQEGERGEKQEVTVERELVPPDIVGESDWLPAIELFGEGIFFTFDEAILTEWEAIPGVRQRADEIAQRYEKTDMKINRGGEQKDPVISARFILLHTLSHLLIRELESHAGYPAASLAERIYCSKALKMSGILIYTAVADIAGSLGGIIESAKPREFLKIMANAFKHAEWCSLDPVCTEHEGQGPGWLNRAACHACSLIPEPSCEYNNVFLDRVFIRGSEKQGIPRFLDFVTCSNPGEGKNGETNS